MQTTLRIPDALYREAKAEAAREGTTLTRFLEEGLRLRIDQKIRKPSKPHFFRVYNPGVPVPCSDSDIRRIADEEQEKHDLAKLGIPRPEAS
ncbi:MAG: hypothetical protein ACOYM3_03760 [Terrimicrobiaceae bacterium]